MTNIVSIALDDLFNVTTFRDTFGISLHTPNLDRLMGQGVNFENANASIAVCNPSRTSVLTGQSPFNTGMHVTEPQQWNDIYQSEDTLVHILKDAGYVTMGSGKTFHNQTRESDFDTFAAMYDAHFQSTAALTLPAGRVAVAQPAGEAIKDDENVAWAASQLAGYAQPEPLFMTVGIIRPHQLFIVPQEYFDLYPQEDIVLPSGTDADLLDVSPFYQQFRLLTNYDNNLKNNDLDVEFVQGYLASITYADAKIGELLDAIEANPNLADDTAILLWSDHGYHLGQKNTWNKFTLWEEAANTPMMLAHPDLAGGTTVGAPVSLLDIFPTVLDIAGVAPPAGNMPDGTSLMPLALDPAHPDWQDASALTSMIGSLSLRTDDFRLIFYNDASVELYDMTADPEQQTNLAPDPAYQTILDDLTVRLVAKAAAQGAIIDPDALSLTGTIGADTFIVTPGQTARGGAGDDLYLIADGAVVDEAPGEGFDTIILSDIAYEIPLGVELVRSTLHSNNIPFDIHGNAEANRVLLRGVRGEVDGAEGNDRIDTYFTRDTIWGGEGDDYLRTIAGPANELTGGQGADTVLGGSGSDSLWGDHRTPASAALSGDDVIVGDVVGGVLEGELPTGPNGEIITGRHVLITDAGTLVSVNGTLALDDFAADIASLPLGDFEFYGGDDWIDAGAGNDVVVAQGGDDYVILAAGDDTAFGDAGADTVLGGNNADVLVGGRGADLLLGQGGDDTLLGGLDGDTLQGGNGDDLVRGDGGSDVILGQGGNDSLLGAPGDDSISAGAGSDTLSGGGGADTLEGGSGADVIAGNAGADLISGGSGHDLIFGGGGADRLGGDAGNDTLVGQSGNDLFLFAKGWGADSVSDFNPRFDRIAFSSDLWTGTKDVDALLMDHATQEGSAVVFRFDSSEALTVVGATLLYISHSIDII